MTNEKLHRYQRSYRRVRLEPVGSAFRRCLPLSAKTSKPHSTVTLLARLRVWSTSSVLKTAKLKPSGVIGQA